MKSYATVPGRGLLTVKSIQERVDHLKMLRHELPSVWNSSIDRDEIQHNIESYVGSVEIPVGLVGPLLFNEQGDSEEVFTLGGTLEGALIASMNRGAKAISVSGGFEAEFIHQRMIRVPLFFFSEPKQPAVFITWILENKERIRNVVEAYSNHAKLVDLEMNVQGTEVHLGFVYRTGDASGQNMTTTCTWHGMMWILEHFPAETGVAIDDAIIEGNGSSDKKVSQFLVSEGRGCKVIARADLEEEVIRRVLRTGSDAILKCYSPSNSRAKEMGMLAFNINVANAIAAIFVATGQDLASVHESSMAQLNLEKSEKGLKLELILPSLVIGTVGGGTHLTDRREALNLMGCAGAGKIERFAKLIAGFALSLEISTYAAIVSGEFAKAHEKLGRNKPVSWLTKAEVDEAFIRNILSENLLRGLNNIHLSETETEKGILTLLSKRVNRKFIGFIPAVLEYADKNRSLLIKNKATDQEVIKGLQLVSASVNVQLAQLITQNREHLEYRNCHLKEPAVYHWLTENGIDCIPAFYGSYLDEKREICLLLIEKLDVETTLMDCENKPEKWSRKAIENTIRSLAEIHRLSRNEETIRNTVQEFDSSLAADLYGNLAQLTDQDHAERLTGSLIQVYREFTEEAIPGKMWKCLVHNDLNPRNAAIRANEQVVIYDWELSVWHYPQRDSVELLSFLADAHSDEDLLAFLEMYRELADPERELQRKDWWKMYRFTLMEFMLTRASFYVVADVVIETKFAHRVLNNAFRMKELIEQELAKMV